MLNLPLTSLSLNAMPLFKILCFTVTSVVKTVFSSFFKCFPFQNSIVKLFPLHSNMFFFHIFYKFNFLYLNIMFSLRLFGEGNGTPLQYSCLENPMDRGAWKAAVHGVTEGRTRLSDFTFTFHVHALEKETATHSSVLPGESQGWGSHLWGCTESDTTEAT